MFINTDFIFEEKKVFLEIKSTFRSEAKAFSLITE